MYVIPSRQAGKYLQYNKGVQWSEIANLLVVFLQTVPTTRLAAAAPTIVLLAQRSFVLRARSPLAACSFIAFLFALYGRFFLSPILIRIKASKEAAVFIMTQSFSYLQMILSCAINQDRLITRYCRTYWKLLLKLQRVVEAKFCSIKNKERRTMDVGRHRKTLRINNRE